MFSKVFISALFAAGALAATPVQIHHDSNTAKCLDVRGDVLANGTAVQIYDCNGTGAQNWLINSTNTKVQLANTNFCLDAGNNPANFVPMKIWKCIDDIPAQAWNYTPGLSIKLTTMNLCLDLPYGDVTNGKQLQTFQCGTGNTNQIWTT